MALRRFSHSNEIADLCMRKQDKQMVRRVQQARGWFVLPSEKGRALHSESGAVPGVHDIAKPASQIFIDEIDSLFRERSAGDHEVTSMMKAEFMT